MPETSIKDQMRKLIDLQKIDSEIYDINIELTEKPAAIGVLKQEFESKKAHLHELEEKVKTIVVARKDKELELQKKEDDISKANTQLSEIKTNKEYTAKISEIEHMKADKSILEEKVLVSYDEAEAVNKQIEKEKEVVNGHEKNYLEQKKKVEDEVAIMKDRLSVLEGQRSELLPNIDKIVLPIYERLIQNRQGLAIVPVTGGNSCGGCHMNVTQQQINAIQMNDELVHCEFCNRIFYLEGEF